VNIIAPVFIISEIDANRSPVSVRDNFNIAVTTPGAVYSGNQTAAADLPIDLSIVNANPVGIVTGFNNAQTGGVAVTQVLLHKDSTYSDYVYTGTPTTIGRYQIQASATGVATATSGIVRVNAPELRFSTANVTVGKGLKTYLYEVYVYRAVNGTVFSGNEALMVNLTCSSSVICKVPASVTIPAGSASAYFLVEGVGLGNTTVTASGLGYSAPQDLAINVVKPQLNFNEPGNTVVGGKPYFSVALTTPGASYSGSQTASSAIAVNITSSAPGVATVPAIITIPASSTSSNAAQLTGVGTGTTRLTASGSDLQSVTSNVITINP
jgi:hypothetical protein